MNLANLDLNLVVALRALLEERNVTRAGQRIGLSQPAMSGSLARLRRHFDDELLVRVGGQYELTALGRVLLDRTAAVCDMTERLFSSKVGFDPETESREFHLVCSDYAVTVLGTALVRALRQEAPRVRVRFTQTPADIVGTAATVLSAVDGVLMPHGIISGFPAVELYEDEWVFVVAEDNTEVGDHLTRDDLARLPWVTYQRVYDAPPVHQLGLLGIEPQVEISVDSFQVLPFLVAGTHRIALTQRRLVERLLASAPVRIMPAPYEAAPLREALWWHPVHSHDAAHTWLRETAARVARSVMG
ncbi:LysR family transcriptional regulator [Streptomyces sp. NPDC051636]|uniref:LysR family transcriptional regulator n=1 Tax=Streptomyces sp. NPDC051636 TaxID=3365663 RepID=UPI0037B5569B